MDRDGFVNGTLHPDGYLLCALRNGTRCRRESREDVSEVEREQRSRR